MKIKRTPKQKAVMQIILKAAGEGEFLSIVEIHKRLADGTAYGTMRRTIEHLEHHAMLVKERTGMSVAVIPTHRAYEEFR